MSVRRICENVRWWPLTPRKWPTFTIQLDIVVQFLESSCRTNELWMCGSQRQLNHKTTLSKVFKMFRLNNRRTKTMRQLLKQWPKQSASKATLSKVSWIGKLSTHPKMNYELWVMSYSTNIIWSSKDIQWELSFDRKILIIMQTDGTRIMRWTPIMRKIRRRTFILIFQNKESRKWWL